MNMGMVDERARPSVETAQHANLATKIACIRTDIEQSQACGAHDDGVEKSLMSPQMVMELLRKVEHHVKMPNRQDLVHPGLDPGLGIATHALRARAVPAGVVGVVLHLAVNALEDMTAKCRSAAVLNRLHRLEMGPR